MWNPQRYFNAERRQAAQEAAGASGVSAPPTQAELDAEWAALEESERQHYHEEAASELSSSKVKMRVRACAQPVAIASDRNTHQVWACAPEPARTGHPHFGEAALLAAVAAAESLRPGHVQECTACTLRRGAGSTRGDTACQASGRPSACVF